MSTSDQDAQTTSPANETQIEWRDIKIHQHFDFLDILSSLGGSLGGTDSDKEKIFEAVRVHVAQLISFDTMGFLMVDPEMFDFVLTSVFPAESSAWVQSAVDESIQKGSFAWALQQSHAVVIHQNNPSQTVVLHPLVTRKRALGMFVGIARDQRVRNTDTALRLLSIILLQGAYALDNSDLRNKIYEQNQALEKSIEEKTRSLQTALSSAESMRTAQTEFLTETKDALRAITVEMKTTLSPLSDEDKASWNIEPLQKQVQQLEILAARLILRIKKQN